MAIKVVKEPITRKELLEMASEEYGNVVKAVIDLEQRIMAVGGELHADEEVLLIEQEGSKREYTWGVNLYLKNPETNWVEFDSMINLKPAFGNNSRTVESVETHQRIKEIIKKLVRE